MTASLRVMIRRNEKKEEPRGRNDSLSLAFHLRSDLYFPVSSEEAAPSVRGIFVIPRDLLV